MIKIYITIWALVTLLGCLIVVINHYLTAEDREATRKKHIAQVEYYEALLKKRDMS